MSRKVFDSNELAELDRIATATERIASSLEELTLLLKNLPNSNDISPKDEQLPIKSEEHSPKTKVNSRFANVDLKHMFK